MESITYRWLDAEGTPTAAGESDWARVEAILEVRGWMSLPKHRRGIRALLAEDAQGAIVGFLVFQWVPFVGPMFVRPSSRGSGVAQQMAEQMFDFLVDVKARGWLSTAESHHAELLMQNYHMVKLETPVYIMGGLGGVEV